MHVPLELFSSLCSQKWRTSPFWGLFWRRIPWRWRAWSGSSLRKYSSLSHLVHDYILFMLNKVLLMCLLGRQPANRAHCRLSAAVLRRVVLLGLLYCWLRLLKFLKLSTFLACMIFSSMLGPAMAFDERGSCTLKTNFVNVPAVSRDSC